MGDSVETTTWKAPAPPLLRRARMVMAIEVIPLVLAVLGLWRVGFSWTGFALFVVMYVLCMTAPSSACTGSSRTARSRPRRA
jgi:hypothetical protein